MTGKTRRILRRPCRMCARMLPKRAYRALCATCTKIGQGRPAVNEWDEMHLARRFQDGKYGR